MSLSERCLYERGVPVRDVFISESHLWKESVSKRCLLDGSARLVYKTDNPYIVVSTSKVPSPKTKKISQKQKEGGKCPKRCDVKVDGGNESTCTNS